MILRVKLRRLQRCIYVTGPWWLWVEYLLLFVGVIFLGSVAIATAERFVYSRVSLHNFVQQQRIKGITANQSNTADALEVADPLQKQREPVTSEKLSHHQSSPIAVLDIPRLNISVPVLDGTDKLTLNHAVGRIAGTAWPGGHGNIGIAGHRDTFFGELKEAQVGDVVELKRMGGTDIYKVDHIQIVQPDNVSVLSTTDVPSLTLVTCYPFHFVGSAPKRFIVAAVLLNRRNNEQTLNPPTQSINSIRRSNELHQTF